ncbi:MAG TPA: hypothetical protein VKS79_21910 [Gemmataceae bacterium]|nr:hypothetical protein [Gemmataceae bacterium]
MHSTAPLWLNVWALANLLDGLRNGQVEVFGETFDHGAHRLGQDRRQAIVVNRIGDAALNEQFGVAGFGKSNDGAGPGAPGLPSHSF